MGSRPDTRAAGFHDVRPSVTAAELSGCCGHSFRFGHKSDFSVQVEHVYPTHIGLLGRGPVDVWGGQFFIVEV